MADSVHVYAGTAGHSAWFSEDAGESWVHPNSHSGMYLEARVWCFASHAATPEHLYAGTDMGIFRWTETTARWEMLPSPMQDVWAVVHDPQSPQTLLAGTRPAAIYRSTDAGQTWSIQSAPTLSGYSPINMGPTRITQIVFDPVEPDTVWASVEIGGVYRSDDSGRNWTLIDNGLVSADVHGLAVVTPPQQSSIVFATTNLGLHRTTDRGATWQFQELPSHWQYTRAIVPHAGDPAVLFVTNGNGPPGNSGRLLRSRDYGATFEQVRLPGEINSTLWCVAAHPANPNMLFTCTNLGQLFRSENGGNSWEKLAQEFGEVRALHWRPLDEGMRKAPHSVTRKLVKIPNT